MQYNAFIFFNAIETRFVTAQNKIKKKCPMLWWNFTLLWAIKKMLYWCNGMCSKKMNIYCYVITLTAFTEYAGKKKH